MWSSLEPRRTRPETPSGESLSLGPFASVGLRQPGSLALTGKPATTIAGVVRIVMFIAVTLVAFILSHSMIDSGLRRIKTSTFGVYNRLVDGEINAAILITGSSRALTHFDSRTIESSTGQRTYNIGINGSQTDMQVALFQTYLRHNAKPRLLIHNLDSFTFVASHGDVYFPGQYLPYLAEEDLYEALRRIDPDTWKARRLPLYGYAVEDMNFTWLTGLRGFFGWNPAEDRYLGFQPRYSQWTDDFERLKQANPGGVRFEIEPAGVTALEEMLALCQREGISVLLVYSPVYYEMQALEQNRHEIFARFSELASRYAATVWDYSSSPISFRKDYFYNSQHLNADGAAQFSADVAAKLVESSLASR
jgi:hypothetical protein